MKARKKTYEGKGLYLSLAIFVAMLFGSSQSIAVPINVALTGTASQSSTGFGGVASRGIDGNRDGRYGLASVTHTGGFTIPGSQTPFPLSNQWWEVDLGQDFNLNEILIFNRTDGCCQGRLDPFRLSIFDGATEVYGLDVTTFVADIIGSNVLGMTFTPGGIVGDRIRVSQNQGPQWLSLAEVEAYAVTEPGILALFCLGLAGLGFARRKKT